MSLQPVTSQYAVPSASGLVAGARAVAATPRPAEQVEAAASGAGGRHELPPDALEAVQTAARVYEQLLSTDRELRFAATDSGLRIEVFDGSGNLVQRIPPNEAMALAVAKETTWLA